MAEPQTARTPGAKRAGNGEYVFDLTTVNHILGGPDYSTANGACVEGERMIVALMRMPAGTGAEPHSHPNEQWIYILQGTFRARIGEQEVEARPGSVIYVPANVVHSGKATADGDVVFFTCKDASHSLHGGKNGVNPRAASRRGAVERLSASEPIPCHERASPRREEPMGSRRRARFPRSIDGRQHRAADGLFRSAAPGLQCTRPVEWRCPPIHWRMG